MEIFLGLATALGFYIVFFTDLFHLEVSWAKPLGAIFGVLWPLGMLIMNKVKQRREEGPKGKKAQGEDLDTFKSIGSAPEVTHKKEGKF